MKTYPIETSPQLYARIGGAFYLAIIVLGLFGEAFVRSRLVVSGDPAATAHNILGSPLLWRAGIAGDLLMHVCDVPLSVVFYLLMKPISRSLSLLVLLLHQVQTAVLVANKMTLLSALFLLGDGDWLTSFDAHQLQTLAYLSVKLHGYGFGVGLVFFGFGCLVLGYLIFRSGFFPKTLGVLMFVAGACYLVNSFALLLSPAVADALFPWILLPAFIGEASMCLWMLIRGVNVPRWNDALRNAHARDVAVAA